MKRGGSRSRCRLAVGQVSSCLLSIILVAGSPGSSAEDIKPTPKIGFLSPAPPVEHYQTLIQDVLRGLGYTPGRNLIHIERWAGGSEEQLHRDAAELVRLKVEVIQAGSSAAVRAAVRATRTIPIVAVDMESDPVANGWAASLAHPGGNLTGFFLDLPALSGKRLEQLKEIVPGVERVAVLWDAALDRTPLKATQASAKDLGLRIITLEVRRGQDIEQAFRRAARERVQAVLIWGSPMLDGETSRVATIAVQHRLPIAGFFPFHAESGFLMSYGPDVDDLVHRCYVYIDRVLKGEKPSTLPIQGPAKFELVVNLKTDPASVSRTSDCWYILMNGERNEQKRGGCKSAVYG